MARHTCELCGLSFRYIEDFEEHQRVGCVVPAGTGSTFSDKDGDSDAELFDHALTREEVTEQFESAE